MFEGFNKMVKWLSELATPDELVITAIVLVGVILATNITWAIISSKKRKGVSVCIVEHRSLIRRRIILAAAWTYAVIATFVLLNGISIGFAPFSLVALPVIFMLVVYIIEAFFTFHKSNSCCSCGKKSETVEQPTTESAKVVAADAEKPATQTKVVKVVKEVKAVKPKAEKKPKSQPEPQPEPQVAKQEDAPKAQTKPPKTKEAKVREIKEAKAESANILDKIEKEQERIEKLKSQIEKQRLDNERKTDTMVTEASEAYSAETKAALAEATEGAERLEELERKNQPVVEREVEVVENVVTNNEGVEQTQTVENSEEHSISQQIIFAKRAEEGTPSE